MMRDGAFAPAIATKLRAAGIDDVSTARVEGGRSALFLDEKRLGIAARILSWRQNGCTPGAADVAARDLAAFSEDVLTNMGRFSHSKAGTGGTLLPEELVELCYGAIDDEERWVEIMYRAVLSIERTEGRDTTEIEAVFAQVMPHWDRSFQINRQIMINATLGVLLQHVIDRLEIGIALVDETGRVLHHNEVLVGALSRALDAKGPRLRDADASALVARLVGSAVTVNDDAETVILLEGQPIGFLCRPRSLRLTARQRGGPAGLLVVRMPGQQPLRDDQRTPLIELAYGLTRQEALVALKIADGMSPDTVAEALGVSINTIRTHLRRCYEKIGVEGQTEMVARILSGPVGWLSPG
jgi:DNA-binding CsgD family transcriptional regulator